ncbi:MAG: thiazole synthase [Gammaproteobacteria bacterium RIFCSPHIGHO2_12_FULL_41_15]|nr:MAG: thiazole synthase [Gammaproteobacteria bacterium RIFCSPHIGHO2_12_FULL_41_15]
MLKLYNEIFESRLLIGTACYDSLEIMQKAVQASQAEIITVSLRRQMSGEKNENRFWKAIQALNCRLLPNTAGCHNAKDAITTAEMAREIFQTNWIKVEVIGDDYNLAPDPFELVQAVRELVKRGFSVFPYGTEDFILCQRLLDAGSEVLMPWASPIGSGKGLMNPYALHLLRERLTAVPLIVDAGIGKPSDAVRAFELGYDAVLLNSAVALADDPVKMASAFSDAAKAGRKGYEAGFMPEKNHASPSTPVLDTPFWHQVELPA